MRDEPLTGDEQRAITERAHVLNRITNAPDTRAVDHAIGVAKAAGATDSEIREAWHQWRRGA